MGLDKYFPQGKSPTETTEEEKEEIDEQAVRKLVFEHPDVPIWQIPLTAGQTRIQIVETARWVLAMNDEYSIEKRRKEAQRKVAAHHERTNAGGGDKDDEGMSIQAVQKKVRRVFDGQYGRKNAQAHFDDVLEDIENDYQMRVETR